ncbi:MAG: SRPBCC family protein, partial [Solirubrobacteraceae bacterium]
MEHEQSTTIPVSPDRLYGAIADLTNLAKFVPQLTLVRKTDAEHVDVEAEYDGRHQAGEAYFRVDDAA